MSTASRPLSGLSAISASTRASASPAQSPPATAGSPSKAPPAARHVLVEAAWSAIKTPGPLRAFYQRVSARRGAQIAIVAAARKLASSLASSHQPAGLRVSTPDHVAANYAPSNSALAPPTRHGTEHAKGTPRPTSAIQERYSPSKPSTPTNGSFRTGKRALTSRKSAGAAPGRASKPSSGTAARQGTAPEPAL